MLDRQRAVLATPRVKPIISSALIGRLPFGMAALGIILLLRADGRSYALAGLVDGAYAIGVGLAQPAWGRAIDRYGLRLVLGPVAGAFVLASAALAQAGARHAPAALLLPLAVAMGVTMPPLGASMRALWPALVPGELRGAAYSIEAVTQELAFVLGPPLVAGLASALSPRRALRAGDPRRDRDGRVPADRPGDRAALSRPGRPRARLAECADPAEPERAARRLFRRRRGRDAGLR